jgi:hypothetical protein
MTIIIGLAFVAGVLLHGRLVSAIHGAETRINAEIGAVHSHIAALEAKLSSGGK